MSTIGFRRRWLAVLLLVAGFPIGTVQAAPPIEMELVTERGFLPTDSHRWVQFLSKQGLTSIRIRGADPGDRAAITNRGTEERPVFHVTGVLTSRNRLRLPGGEFGLSDREALAAWLKKVETEGAAGPTQQTAAYGLTPEQLVAFHEKVSPPAKTTTQGRLCRDVARDLVKEIGLEFHVTEGARRGFAAEETCLDELKGLSCGTALAAAIRPVGLVFRPEKMGRDVRLSITEVRESPESWPIGWPLQDTPGSVAPKLFDSLNVEINGVSLQKSIEAIQPRVGIPFLFDHNGMLRQRIDPAAIKVKYPKGRAMYQKVLTNLLYQAKLSSALRVDEAGRPFLWISPP